MIRVREAGVKAAGALVVLASFIAALTLAAILYAVDRDVPLDLAFTLLPAFLLEAVLYVLSGLRSIRERLEEVRPAWIALLLTLSAPLSYLAVAAPTQSVSLAHLAVILALATTVSLWFPVFGRRTIADAGFVLLLAAPILFDVFDPLYPDVAPRIPTKMLGIVMWYRTGLVAALTLRRMDGIGFGFLPKWKEWRIGVRQFLWFLLPGMALALSLNFVRVRPVSWEPRTFILAMATFVGVLWVLAVAEEFFFRGLLQQLLSRAFGSETAGLLLASVVFGAAHLGFRDFPNWRFALLAAVAGVFYGRAYMQAGSIRAAMVTHAFVVTTWRTFLM